MNASVPRQSGHLHSSILRLGTIAECRKGCPLLSSLDLPLYLGKVDRPDQWRLLQAGAHFSNFLRNRNLSDIKIVSQTHVRLSHGYPLNTENTE